MAITTRGPVYYNEIDLFAAEWLRNLMRADQIPHGEIDTRSIIDVSLDDLRSFRQCHFFAGIGGWPYALSLAEWGDREVWTGSCPCQPFSSAGQRKGHADERHLWPAFQHLIAKRRPAAIFGEQVASKDGREWLAGVRADLEALGYAVGATDLCAASAGAPHIRQRLFWVADARRSGDELGRRIRDVPSPAEDLEGQAREWQRSGDALADSGATGRMADAGRSRQHAALSGDAREESAAQSSRNDIIGYCGAEWRAGGAVGGLDDAKCQRWEWRQGAAQGRLLDGPNAGRQQSDHGSLGPDETGFWSDSIWLPCLDGAARRIESGTFPLVTRLHEGMGSDRPGEASPFRIIRDPETGKDIGQAPWRVGMLRGYGNSIVPQVAAEFIKSFLGA